MRLVMFIVGVLVIFYGVILVAASVSPLPLSVIIPVPWSTTPATLDNPQLEPGAVLVLLGALIAFAAIRR
jgi:hypothetical protein